MSKYSTIQVSNVTKSRLNGLRLTPNESYENVLIRLLNVRLDGRELSYLIHTNNNRFTLQCSVDWGCDDLKIIYYDNDGRGYFSPPPSEVDGWNEFIGEVNSIHNLINVLAILEVDDDIRVGELMVKRTK